MNNLNFVRTSRGEYMLRDVYEQSRPTNSSAEPTVKELEDEIEVEVEESTGIIQAFGMYWTRSLIVWNAKPVLMGQQQTGAKPVNFADQRGVYLLYDDRDVIYVGRALDQALSRRLYQHTVDRLSSRWNKFSWFGLARVMQDGSLVAEDSRPLSPEVLVATMEALLIEGLEPPQNRRRGMTSERWNTCRLKTQNWKEENYPICLTRFRAG
jgi:hypothetical protein